MRHAIIAIALFIFLVLANGSPQAAGKQAVAPTQSQAPTGQLDKAKAETKEAALAVEDYSYEKRAEFVTAMKKELAAIKKELDRLSTKVAKSKGKVRADAKIKLAAVRKQWTRAKKQLDRAENATESTWDDVKGGFGKAYGDLKDSFQSTRQWLSDKIEP